MADRYIILSNDIHMIGGGQKYTANKLRFVAEKGWIPKVIYCDNPRNSKIYLSALTPYKNNYIKDMVYPPGFYSANKVAVVLEKISRMIDYREGDHVVIETNTTVAAQWGELFASRTKGTHIAYMLSEHFSMNDDVRKFLYFKYQQRKLYGTGKQSLLLMFPDHIRYPIEEESIYLRAYGGDAVDFHHTDFPIKLEKYLYKICIFGRLDKHFVIPVMHEIKQYCEAHQNEEYLVAVIGGSDRKNELKPFIKMFSDVKNADFYCTGPIFPVPKDWFTDMDVAIATAGAAGMAAQLGCPTISICVQNEKPLGILGYTTASTRDMNNETVFDKSLHEYLDMILVDKYCENHDFSYPYFSLYKYDHEKEAVEFSRQLSLAEKKDTEYYDVNMIKYPLSEKIKGRMLKSYWLRMLWHRVKILYH